MRACVLRVPHQQRKAVEAVSVLSLMLTLFDQRPQSSPPHSLECSSSKALVPSMN